MEPTAAITNPTQTVTGQYRSFAPGFSSYVWPIAQDRAPFTPDIAPWMLVDPTVRIGMQMLVGPVASSEWTVKANSPEVGQFVEDTLRDIWDVACASTIAAAEGYGHLGAEVVYEQKKGRLYFSSLLEFGLWDSRPLMLNGKIVGVQVDRGAILPTFSPGPLRLTQVQGVQKGFWYHQGGSNRNVYGHSTLEPSYEPWLDLNLPYGLRASQRLWYTRNPFSSGVMEYPEGYTAIVDENGVPTGTQRSNMDLAREMTSNMLAGASILLPSTKDEKGNPLWRWIDPKANPAPTDMMTVIQEAKRDIWRGMGIQDEIIVASGTGSGYSGREIPLEGFLKARELVRNRFWRAMESQVVRPLVAYNFGPGAEFEVEFKKLFEQDRGEGGQQPAPGQPPRPPGLPGMPPVPDPSQMSVTLMEAAHAPAGGVKVGGKEFKGGEFIPGEVMAEATPEERAKVDGKASSEPTGADVTPDAEAAKADWKANGVKSKAFKSWFGDWENDPKNASKVVDESGNPLVVYHGTADQFDSFDTSHRNRHDAGWLGTGAYLTTSLNTAESYSKLKRGSSTPRVLRLHANLRNPYIATLEDKKRIRDIEWTEGKWAAKDAADKWTDELRKLGHDGVILTLSPGAFDKGVPQREIVVFDPSNVKHADNAGTFDPENPNIYMGAESDNVSEMAVRLPPAVEKATRFTDRIISEASKAGTAISQQAKRRLL